MQEVMSAWTSEGDEKVTAVKPMAVYEAELGDKDTTGNAKDDLDNADGAMRMSKDSIESSMHISKYILSDNELKAMAFHAETLLRDKSPWHTMSNLKLLASKAKARDECVYIMQKMLDLAVTDPSQAQWSSRALSPRNQKGLFDKWTTEKKRWRCCCTTHWMASTSQPMRRLECANCSPVRKYTETTQATRQDC